MPKTEKSQETVCPQSKITRKEGVSRMLAIREIVTGQRDSMNGY